ncbi:MULTISPECIES: hypothetical protein [Rhodomicrobium]|uniref:hypothetical protein n=1 Tax=Rhodomicrobium TaxID=1068 RepID=UPI000F746E50|nr:MULTISPECIES: hypothetical protein [Rhodomicrobium]
MFLGSLLLLALVTISKHAVSRPEAHQPLPVVISPAPPPSPFDSVSVVEWGRTQLDPSDRHAQPLLFSGALK